MQGDRPQTAETITPYKVALLVMVDALKKADMEGVGWFGLYLLTSTQKVRLPEPTFEEILEEVSGRERSSALISFLKTSFRSMLFDETSDITSPNPLYDFFCYMGTMVTETDALLSYSSSVDTLSPIGLFLRRIDITFRNLMFDGLARIWSDVFTFVYPRVEETVVSRRLSSLELDQLFAQEFERFAKDVGVVPQEELFARLKRLSSFASDHRVDYLKYVMYLEYGEYEGALASLHRYFDYAIAQRPWRSRASAEHLSDEEKSLPSLLPYASLNMAHLHYQFGHLELAMNYVEEAMNVAHKEKDEQCLAMALSWLYQLVRSHATDHQREYKLLTKLLTRASSLGDSVLSAKTLLSLLQHHVLHPRLQGIDAGHRETAPSTQPHFVMHLVDVTSRLSSPEMYTSTTLLSANIWETMGFPLMSRLTAQAIFHGPKKSATSSDAIRSLLLLAHQMQSGGDEGKALSILKYAKTLKPYERGISLWRISCLQVLHTMSLNQGYDNLAVETVSHLLSLTTSLSHSDGALLVDARFRQAQSYALLGDFEGAVVKLQQLCQECLERGMELQTALFHLTLGQYYLNARAPTSALTPLIKGRELTVRYNLTSLRCYADILLAEVRLEVSDVAQARKLLLDAMVPVHQHCDLAVISKAYYLLARVSHTQDAETGERDALESLDYLDRAETGYVQLKANAELMHLYALRALVYDFLKDEAKREVASLKFVGVKAVLEKNQLEPITRIEAYRWYVEESS